MMHALRKFFVHSPGHYIGALIIAIAVGVFRFLTLSDDVGVRFRWYEVLSVSGFATFLVGALMTVSYWGAFDIFGYALSPGRFRGIKKYKDYNDYSKKKAEKRASGANYFVPYYVVGVVVMLFSYLFR